MNESNNTPQPPIPAQPVPPAFPPYREPLKVTYPTGRRELIFAACILIFSCLSCNCLIYAGANLGFAVGVMGMLLSTAAYLWACGRKPDWYTATLLALCLVIAAAYLRSGDGSLKFLMGLVLCLVPGMAFAITAGQNLHAPAGFTSLLDGPRTLFMLGMGTMNAAFRGLRDAFRASGTLGKKGGAVALGLLIAIPLMAVMIPLLMSADAAFEGLLALLPEFQWRELLATLLLGGSVACVLYTRGVALEHSIKSVPAGKKTRGLNSLTVNTVLTAVAVVYAAYLLSQLAYFVGGFSGILPEGFTMAQYARRGFFEMAWLSAINLAIISFAIGLVKQSEKLLLTRLICLFLGIVTVFLVATASAKMFLYIGSYGLTRLRVLTEVFMLWLAAVTVFVCIWLFRQTLPYMKLAMVLGLVLCACLFWADVDTQIARYNVRSYQEGRLESVDVYHLGNLSYGAVPYLAELTEDHDPEVAAQARDILSNWYISNRYDIRDWNLARVRAADILEEFHRNEAAEVIEFQ